MKRSRGFTLIEIIVVLVIMGILAAIALPNIFSWIQKSRSAEGLASLGTIKDELIPCLAAHGTTNLAACGFPSGCTYPTAEANESCFSVSGFGSGSGLGEGVGFDESGNLSGNFYYLVVPNCLNLNSSNFSPADAINVSLGYNISLFNLFGSGCGAPSGSLPWTIIATYKDGSGSLLLTSTDVSVAATCAGQGAFQGVC